MLGHSGGPLLAFHAPRGLGKTSLLRMAQRDALAEGFLTVWVTGRDDRPMSRDVAQGLSAAVKDHSFGGRADILLDRLDQVQVEFGIPGVKVGATLSAEDKAPGSAVLEKLLEDAGRFSRTHSAKWLVVFVDEFQEAQLGDRKSLLIGLQHFDGAPDAIPVAVITAGLPSLPPAVTEAATFGERSRFVELGCSLRSPLPRRSGCPLSITGSPGLTRPSWPLSTSSPATRTRCSSSATPPGRLPVRPPGAPSTWVTSGRPRRRSRTV